MGNITLKNVSKSFGSTTIIPNIDLVIEDGEFVVFVGPSGCGKSTLLRLIAGLEDTSGGTINIDGRDVTGEAPAKRKLAMVFQSYALYPHMTVAKNIAFPLKMAGEDQATIDRKVKDAARVLNLTNYLERRPGQLSGGQRQRVAIARAIATRPSLIVLDEAVSALDVSVRGQILDLLLDLQREERIAYLFISHDLGVVRAVAHRLVILDAGRVAESGEARAVIGNPQSAIGKALVAATPKLNRTATP
ncbi:MAG: ABC transporter ATP-binding protein [Mesorhizobium sp.]|nr:MAG: ABC transporter ATP-binding protein [Mesorhizobium sp.]